MGYPWFFVFVSLVATKTGSRPQCDFRVVGFVFLGFLVGFPMCFPCLLSWLALMPFKLACLVSPLLKQVSLDPVRCLPKSVVSYFWGCLGCAHSVLFVSSCGPWCQKNLIFSWLALFPSLLCSLCLRCFPSFKIGYPWFFVFVSLVATKTGSRP